MNLKLTMLLMMLFVVIADVGWANERPEEENSILVLVLKQSFSDGGYTVVTPNTAITHVDFSDVKEVDTGKEYVKEQLRAFGGNVPKLVDRLFERNKKAVRLSIKSSYKDGYVVDYEGKFQKYFEKDGGGWGKWYKENPKAHGSTTVSLPVYDEKAGLILIYKGCQTDWLAGAGFVILYKYEQGELKELGKVMLWIS